MADELEDEYYLPTFRDFYDEATRPDEPIEPKFLEVLDEVLRQDEPAMSVSLDTLHFLDEDVEPGDLDVLNAFAMSYGFDAAMEPVVPTFSAFPWFLDESVGVGKPGEESALATPPLLDYAMQEDAASPFARTEALLKTTAEVHDHYQPRAISPVKGGNAIQPGSIKAKKRSTVRRQAFRYQSVVRTDPSSWASKGRWKGCHEEGREAEREGTQDGF